MLYQRWRVIYLKLERLAIDASQKTGRSIKWTEALSYMIDHYAKDAAIDMVSQEELKKKNNVIPFPAFSRLPAKERKDTV